MYDELFNVVACQMICELRAKNVCLQFKRKMSSTHITSKMEMVCVASERGGAEWKENNGFRYESILIFNWIKIRQQYQHLFRDEKGKKMRQPVEPNQYYHCSKLQRRTVLFGEWMGCSNSKLMHSLMIGSAIWFCIHEMCTAQSDGVRTQKFPNNLKMNKNDFFAYVLTHTLLSWGKHFTRQPWSLPCAIHKNRLNFLFIDCCYCELHHMV